MIRGETKNIALSPVANKDLDEAATFIPNQVDLRNGRMDQAGNWIKRPGFSSKWETGVSGSVDLLIPAGQGYAVLSTGAVVRLGASPTALTGTMDGTSRPTWVNHDGTIIIADGGSLKQIAGNTVRDVPGSPPAAKYLATMNSYVLTAGQSDTELRWSDAGSHTVWTDSNVTDVEGNGEHIQNLKVLERRIYIFKSGSIEIWGNVGGTQIFARNYYINTGIQAPHSVVEANNTFYFWGDDGDFYSLNGTTPQVISTGYRRELDTIKNRDDCVGWDFRAEHVIRWLFPTEGRIFTFDYMLGFFSEDSMWRNGQWERLPINSAMLLNGKTYVGDYEPTGKVFEWSDDHKTDNGRDIRVFREANVRLSANGYKTRVNRLQLRTKRGVATDDEGDPEVAIQWRFDRGEWSGWRNYSLGKKGDYDPYINIPVLGVGRELSIRVAETDAVQFLVTDLNVTARQLGR